MAIDEAPVARVLLPIEVDCAPDARASGPMATAWVVPVALACQPRATLCLFCASAAALASTPEPMATESSPSACVLKPTAIALPFLSDAKTPVATEFLPIAIELASIACAPVPTATVSLSLACVPVPKAIASAPADLALRPMAVLRLPDANVPALAARPCASLPPTAIEYSPVACVQLPRDVAPTLVASARAPIALVHSCEAMVSEPIEIALFAFALLA